MYILLNKAALRTESSLVPSGDLHRQQSRPLVSSHASKGFSDDIKCCDFTSFVMQRSLKSVLPIVANRSHADRLEVKATDRHMT